MTNTTQTFPSRLFVNNGTYLADTTGALTIPATGNSVLGAGSVSVNGANSLLHVNTTGNLAYNRNTSIDNGDSCDCSLQHDHQ